MSAEADFRFRPGDKVRVSIRYPHGHCRTPFYLRGHRGEVVEPLGVFPNPEELAYLADSASRRALYHVAFDQTELWPAGTAEREGILIADLFEHWLEPEPTDG